jgi:hypothetical protein
MEKEPLSPAYNNLSSANFIFMDSLFCVNSSTVHCVFVLLPFTCVAGIENFCGPHKTLRHESTHIVKNTIPATDRSEIEDLWFAIKGGAF